MTQNSLQPPSLVFLPCHGFEMTRVHTCPIPADMVQVQPFGHLSIGVSMSEDNPRSVPELAIAVLPYGGLPKPAVAGLIDFRPEEVMTFASITSTEGDVGVTTPKPPGVVLRAEALPKVDSATAINRALPSHRNHLYQFTRNEATI